MWEGPIQNTVVNELNYREIGAAPARGPWIFEACEYVEELSWRPVNMWCHLFYQGVNAIVITLLRGIASAPATPVLFKLVKSKVSTSSYVCHAPKTTTVFQTNWMRYIRTLLILKIAPIPWIFYTGQLYIEPHSPFFQNLNQRSRLIPLSKPQQITKRKTYQYQTALFQEFRLLQLCWLLLQERDDPGERRVIWKGGGMVAKILCLAIHDVGYIRPLWSRGMAPVRWRGNRPKIDLKLGRILTWN